MLLLLIGSWPHFSFPASSPFAWTHICSSFVPTTFCSCLFFTVQPPQHKCLCWEACNPSKPITVLIHWSLDEQIRATWKPVTVPVVTSLSEQQREMLSEKPVCFVPVTLPSGVSRTIKYNQVEEKLSGRNLFLQSWEMIFSGCGLFFFLSQNDPS